MFTATAPLSTDGFSSNWLESTRLYDNSRPRYAVRSVAAQAQNYSSWTLQPATFLVSPRRAIADLQSIIRGRLGFFAASRFNKLAGYRPGWDGEQAKPLSARSAALAAAFLDAFTDFPTRPSIFLTRTGHLALGWENRSGARIEVIFDESECRVSSPFLCGTFRARQLDQIKGIARSLAA